MQTRVFRTLLLFMLILFCQFSFSQSPSCASSCCCATDPSPAGMMISHLHKKNEWMFSYRFMFMQMGSLYKGTSTTDANTVYQNYLMSPESMRMNMHMLMGMYGISDKLTIMAMLNYSSATMDMTMLPGSSHMHNGVLMASGNQDMTMKSSGINDIKLSALYGIVHSERHQVFLIAGLSIPVGSTSNSGNASYMSEERLPYSMQSGSGTWDLLPGIQYMYTANAITLVSQLTATLRPGYNTQGYRLGQEAVMNNWAAWRWSNHFSSSLRLEGVITGGIQGIDPSLSRENEPSADPRNYGGERISGYIGTNYSFTGGALANSRLGLEYGIPFYQNLNGIQMGAQSSLFASYSISF